LRRSRAKARITESTKMMIADAVRAKAMSGNKTRRTKADWVRVCHGI
jgi:hypothetical protein